MAVIDHLVYAVPDLAAGVERFAAATGVRPAMGGAHIGRGTHNALVSFGTGYIELIAPDPGQPRPTQPRPFGIDDLDAPRLVTFAVRPDEGNTIDDVVAVAGQQGYDAGPIVDMSRRTPAGELLEWRLTFPRIEHAGIKLAGAVPFVIDWGETTRPNTTAPGGIELTSFVIAHSNDVLIETVCAALGLADVGPQRVVHGASESLTADVTGPSGTIDL